MNVATGNLHILQVKFYEHIVFSVLGNNEICIERSEEIANDTVHDKVC